MDAPNYGNADAGGSNEPYVFTTVRWAPELAKSPENTAASCGRPCPFYMLEHHWTRLQVVRWTSDLPRGNPADLLHDLLKALQRWAKEHPSERPESMRMRHRVYYNGSTFTEMQPLPRISLNCLFPQTFGEPGDSLQTVDWTVVLDAAPIQVSAATMYKTSDRSFYDRARSTAGIKSYREPKEVIMFNEEHNVLDASISTPYFYRNGRWVTPEASCGGQQGTTRRWALERRFCVEGIIKIAELRDGEIIWLSNASKGYFRARYIHGAID